MEGWPAMDLRRARRLSAGAFVLGAVVLTFVAAVALGIRESAARRRASATYEREARRILDEFRGRSSDARFVAFTGARLSARVEGTEPSAAEADLRAFASLLDDPDGYALAEKKLIFALHRRGERSPGGDGDLRPHPPRLETVLTDLARHAWAADSARAQAAGLSN